MGGLPEPMRCMSYFPVIIKRSHLKDMRDYIFNIHHKQNSSFVDFDDVFKYGVHLHKRMFSQFNLMCGKL